MKRLVLPDPGVQRGRRRVVLSGDVPRPIHPPSGCRFHSRGSLVQDRNRVEEPALRDVTRNGHFVACHLVGTDGEAPDLGMGAVHVHD